MGTRNTESRKTYQALVEKMKPLRVPGMRRCLQSLIESGEICEISNMDMLVRMTEAELESRRNTNVERLKKKAHIQQPFSVLEEWDDDIERGVPMSQLNQLATNSYIDNHRNVVVMGASGCGKSFLVSALANRACEKEYNVQYFNQFELLQMLADNSDDNGYLTAEARKKLGKYDVLVIDDFLITGEIQKCQTEQLFQLVDLYHGRGTLIIGSQMAPKEWHKVLGGNQMADAIVDRIVGPSIQLILKGDSRRMATIPETE